ncbi:membrane-bound transcription factor site-2 protease isoform X4 [Sorex araneus]|uniref:membrane-bound transcription factor site-2 protease isoform X4 n=1 Tax=Sorex araneus TaxID=42254 RepID=UPI002433E84B|nr:membrane-bound transcription factor site-2 protease isoform X4 [Sorex araneus]
MALEFFSSSFIREHLLICSPLICNLYHQSSNSGYFVQTATCPREASGGEPSAMADSSGAPKPSKGPRLIHPDGAAAPLQLTVPQLVQLEALPVEMVAREMVGEYGDLSGSWIYGGHHHPPLIGLQPLLGSCPGDSDQELVMVQTEEEVVGYSDEDSLSSSSLDHQLLIPDSAEFIYPILAALPSSPESSPVKGGRNVNPRRGPSCSASAAQGSSSSSSSISAAAAAGGRKWEPPSESPGVSTWSSTDGRKSETVSRPPENASAEEGREKTQPSSAVPCFDLSDPREMNRFTQMLATEVKEEKPRAVPCPQQDCTKMFKDVSSMRKHLHTHGPRAHVCAECGKGFVESSKLKRHHLVHTGEKPFECPFEGCGKRFSLDFNLRTHLRIHTGDRPFVCPFDNCKKKFSQSTNLKAHLSTHNKKK